MLKTKQMKQQHSKLSKKRLMQPTQDSKLREQRQNKLDLQLNRLPTQKRQSKPLKMPERKLLLMKPQEF